MRLDQYESRFKRAAKSVFEYAPVPFETVLLVTDAEGQDAEAELERARAFLQPLGSTEGVRWVALRGDQYHTSHELVALVSQHKPDLLITHRSLKEADKDPIYSLGTYLDVLTQVAPVPVLVLPSGSLPQALKRVMVVTDHITGDSRLINYGAALLGEGGDLFLTHIEDEGTFERYLGVISKLPSLDTETARRDILEQLLKEPREFMESVQKALAVPGAPQVEVEPIVRLGRSVRDYRELVEARQVDLLVFNTKDSAQLAMHGMAYSLAVELKRVPLLLL
ncbi:MAG: hypothetical protein KDD82_29015 [Planctomycetes bacterium]|nr:hypothetical protein [Planctomycetota bacterium]